MFQFPGFPCISYVFTYTYPWFSWMGFPIRISADRRIFASPRRFSQLITSFFGFQCQGIHHALFFAWPSRHIALCLMAYSIFRLLWFVFVILLRITGSMSWYFINLFQYAVFKEHFQALNDLQPVALNLFISNCVRNQTHLRNSDERVSFAYECQAWNLGVMIYNLLRWTCS